jgi:hypothetical protein
MKKQNPAHQITVVERNRPYDTFGWGVVFSDQTLGNLAEADAPTAQAIQASFNHWDDIDVFFKGEKVTSGGMASAASAASTCSTSCSSAARNWACSWCSRPS